MVKNRSTLWVAALVVGWAFDILYWNKPPGISFLVHTVLLLGALAVVSWKEGVRPDPVSLVLVPLVLLFSALGFLREEPFTRVLNHLLSLGFLGLLILSYLGGRWYSYTLSDYLVNGFQLFINTIGLPFKLLTTEKEESQIPEGEQPKASGWKRAAPYLRGILIALPLIAILASLLGEADPIFAKWIKDLIELLRLEKLPEYILRLVLIAFWTFLAAGLLLYALTKSKEEKLVGEDKPWPPRFLGSTETTIIMGAINVLFFSFVTIQFKYFFGGEKNIALDGYTYSEYARKGFGELLAVAFFTLFILMVLSGITQRESRRSRITFSVLGGAMTLFIGVILVSSLQRLALYESAYGFSRLRTYSHLCILWIGALFLAILVLEIIQQHRYFTLASLAAVAGFVLTMNAVNVDGLITRQNIQRLQENNAPLDTSYFNTLSNDAIPTLIDLADDSFISPQERKEIGAVLACRNKRLEEMDLKWQSFTLPTYLAKKALAEKPQLWEGVTFQEDQWGVPYIEVGAKNFYCSSYGGWD
ncbi:MAG: DUF4153 domain-containing protein [Anaerolineales bacterium]